MRSVSLDLTEPTQMFQFLQFVPEGSERFLEFSNRLGAGSLAFEPPFQGGYSVTNNTKEINSYCQRSPPACRHHGIPGEGTVKRSDFGGGEVGNERIFSLQVGNLSEHLHNPTFQHHPSRKRSKHPYPSFTPTCPLTQKKTREKKF